MANKRFSLANIFRSKSVSVTNPADDVSNLTGLSPSEHKISGSALEFNGSELVNLNNVVNAVRNTEGARDAIYQEYREMDNEVIIQAALKSYADDATVIDNIRGHSVWIDSNDHRLLEDLEGFLDTIQLDKKVWGWIYQLAQYGDKYFELVYNDRGYLIGIKDVKKPETIYEIVEEGETEGYIVKRDPRLSKYNQGNNQLGNFNDIDIYGPGRYLHIYLSDNPNEETIIIDIMNNNGTGIDYAELEVVRGNSTIEAVRTTNRILRLLEDTVITNKVARSEYIRIFNIETGEATGIGSDSIVRRFKRLFDSRPRFNGNTGEYNSSRNYRPAADALFNAVHNGQGAVDVRELGGDVETKYMTDLEYFRDKMFTGLQIPKSYLGFDQNTSGFDNGGMLQQLDARYSRTVRRIQNSMINGIQDLIDMWLLSRHRTNDVGRAIVKMHNPSSAEEMKRLEELMAKLDAVEKITESVANVGEDSINLPKLYLELINEFVDVPSIRDVFRNLLNKAILIKHININSALAAARTESLNNYQELGNAIEELKSGEDIDDSGLDEDHDSDDFDSDSGDEYGSSFSASQDADFDALGDSDINSEISDIDNGSEHMTDEDTGSDSDVELGSLADTSTTDSGPTGNELLDSARPLRVTSSVLEYYGHGNKSKADLLSDLVTLSLYGPTSDSRIKAEKIAEKLSIEGFSDDNIKSAYDLLNEISNIESKKDFSSKTIKSVTEQAKNIIKERGM